MPTKRLVLATVAVFLLAQVFAIVIHGFVLASDYRPFYGTLLRPMEADPGWQVALLPVRHLAVAIGLVWIAVLAGFQGSVWSRGARLGLIAWLMGSLPMYVLWYAEQPWPGRLVVKQLPLELVAMVVLGTLAARLVSGPSVARA